MTHEPATDEQHLGEYWSVHVLSNETGFARETIRRRLANANIPYRPIANRKAWRCRDAFRVLYAGGDDGAVDPNKLDPHARNSHYKAEKAKLELEALAGEMVPDHKHRAELSRVLLLVKQTFDTLPDVLERDCGLTPEHIARVEATCDAIRNKLADELDRLEPIESADESEPVIRAVDVPESFDYVDSIPVIPQDLAPKQRFRTREPEVAPAPLIAFPSAIAEPITDPATSIFG